MPVRENAPGAAVGGIGAALHQSSLGQTIYHPAQRDRLNLQQFRQRALIAAAWSISRLSTCHCGRVTPMPRARSSKLRRISRDT